MSHIAEIAHEIDELGPLAPSLTDYAPVSERTPAALKFHLQKAISRKARMSDEQRNAEYLEAVVLLQIIFPGLPREAVVPIARKCYMKSGTVFAEQTGR